MKRISSTPAPATDWAALRKEAGLPGDAPPEAVTVLEYAAKFDLTRWVAKAELRKLVVEGKLNVGRKAVRNARGQRIVAEAYWLKSSS